ncbi:hypothetical protein [Flavobacterium reichenbachii]|uniref:Lipoprotein n=1 Tax=Flavobacterium reichenbachii TaxID=362418 RepID=A0A085ZNB4_9FLAO|nr:hypothetical protein [Flavobacterium reichenbachii]KFF05928.1 hypothetical protein IW19_10525 [Flavobacterium reichenbachii]OXB12811.1 hypothetical protein B0A68_18685 [Flavobacterium reichenbachii]
MRKAFFLIFVLVIVSCKKENTESPIVNKKTTVSTSESEVIKRRDFPLKNLSKVEVLSYEDRMRWDKQSTEKEDNKYTKDLVVKYKLNFDSTMIKERVILNSVLKMELLQLMSQDSCKIEEFVSDCYMPRHMILFRDQKNRIIGYKELCLSCKGFRESKNLENYNGFCFSQIEELFKKAGIKYFDDDYE